MILPEAIGLAYHSVVRHWSDFRMTVMYTKGSLLFCSGSIVNCIRGSMLLNTARTLCSVPLGIAMKMSTYFFLKIVASNARELIAWLKMESNTMSARISDKGLPIAVPYVCL